MPLIDYGQSPLADLLRRRSSLVVEAFEDWCAAQEVGNPLAADSDKFLRAHLGKALNKVGREKLVELILVFVHALPRQLRAEAELDELRTQNRDLQRRVDALTFKRRVGRPSKGNYLLKLLVPKEKRRGRPRALDIDPTLLRSHITAQLESQAFKTRKAALNDVAVLLLQHEKKHSVGSQKQSLVRQLQKIDSGARPRAEIPAKFDN